MIHPVGVIHGRFQVLHNDHLRYLLAGKALCEHLVVGITNPDPRLTRDDAADKVRSLPMSNPLTYFERYQLVRAALGEAGVAGTELSVVPLPINLPELYQHYVPLDAVFFLTIYDDWGRRKLEFFRSLGLKSHVLWEVEPQDKGISGTDVRRAIARNKGWEHLVPPSVARLLRAWDIPDRLARLDGAGI
jgi:nicotinamide-nucleotide adenylyltransferase